MHLYIAAPTDADGMTPVQKDAQLDTQRATVIDRDLRPLLISYLEGKIALADFKTRVDSVNKRHEHWGFKGIKGQMFFNLAMNAAHDHLGEIDTELKKALIVPSSEEMARTKILTFVNFVGQLGEKYVEGGGSKSGRPNTGSVPFFVSYFWQVADRNVWPVYYTSSVNVMNDLNLWEPSDDIAENYCKFKHVHEELAHILADASGRPFSLYDVEHVFWFKGSGTPYVVTRAEEKPKTLVGHTATLGEDAIALSSDSYIPPIVAVLPKMARNDPASAKAAESAGTSLERAFEKSINAALTILGYETKLLGQGQGRTPDGLAFEGDSLYALIWDAKIRADGYSIGTDDRAIKEYITMQSRELRGRRWRNIYYLIISSSFKGEYDRIVRALKMETGVSEICFVEAEALVAMVDAKLRDPLQITLGPDGLQQLFSSSEVLTGANVRKLLG